MLAPLLLSTLAGTAPQAVSASDGLGSPTGCWCATDGSGQVLLLEEQRAGWLREGKPSFYRLHATGDVLTLERWARLTELRAVRVEGGKLHVTGDGQDLVLEPCEVPEALTVEPYAWPEGGEVDAETVEALQADLAARIVEDQRVRRFEGQPTQAQMDEMRRVDEDNVEFLAGVVGELGWIDAARFGREAAGDAFLIVQHSADMRLMCTALPLIEADVRAGRLGGQSYALLFDRYRLDLGYPQRYGTQLGRSEEFGNVLMPCEDIDRVDERRAEMGMGALAGYLNLFRAGPDSPPPAYLPELLEAR